MRRALIVEIDRFQIFMPAVESDEMIKAEAPVLRDKPRLRATLKVPFADIAGLVTGITQHFGKEGLVNAQGEMVLHHAVALRVFSGQDAGAERAADRIARISLIELHTFLRQPVDIRCLHHPIAAASHRIGTHLVRIDDEDIRTLAHAGSPVILRRRRFQITSPKRVRNSRK